MSRRRVLRAAAVYAVGGAITVVVGGPLVRMLALPEVLTGLVPVLLVAGFPVVLVVVWARGTRVRVDPTTGSRETDAADWQRVGALFEAALERPAEDRTSFLHRETTNRPGLRREVESLLRAHEGEGLLDRPLSDWLDPSALIGPAVGSVVGRYRIVERLGGGGMGVVYGARDGRLDRSVALKFLPPHLSAREETKQRFMIEAQAAAALDHPNICTVHEIGETDGGRLFIAMPLYDGATLKKRLVDGPVPVVEAVELVIQAARGLAKAHDRGIVHRDIKPANLIVTSDEVLKIVDFGIAKLADVTITRSEHQPGTIAYMSPEQARGERVDGRSDLWSLGVVLYELVTGERPFRGGTDQLVLHAIATEAVTVPPALADDPSEVPLGRILDRLLAKEPDARYAHASDVIRDLERWLGARARRHRGPNPTMRSAEDPRSLASADEERLLADESERRPATALVATLSGYAGLVERLPPEQLTAVVERIRFASEEIATRHGGILNEFRHDELVFLFGVPTAQEDHSVRAVRAGLELHERVRAMRRDGGRVSRDVRLHSGIERGLIVARRATQEGARYLVTGETVQVARRLAGHAAADEVWISGDCHRAVGPYFDTEARPPVASPGRDRGIAARRVVRHTGIHSRLEAAVRTGLTRYIGRERELLRLQEAMDAAVEGGGRLVVVTGEAGLGKSRLLYEFRRRVAERGLQLLVGHCQAHGTTTSYLPFAEVLRGALGVDDAEGPARAASRVALRAVEISPELSEFVPLYLHLLDLPTVDHPLPSHLHGDQLRVAIQEATSALLGFAARVRPLVLLLEDWHWADEASQAVLEQIMDVAADDPLLVVVTSRSSFTWRSAARHEIVTLEPLGEEHSAAMLRAIAGVDDFDEPVAELLHARTGGNPFFLEEVCHALLEDGTLQVGNGRVRLTGPPDALQLPDTVQAAILTRLERLEHEGRDLVRIGSVIGREFSRSVLERAMPNSARLPNALQTVKEAGLIQQVRVVPEATYRFKHVLTQEVAYNGLLEHQRRELHGRVAAAIEQVHEGRLQDQLQQLAHHHRRAEHWREAIGYGVRAADRLHALSEFAEALQQLERCEEWLDHTPIEEQVRRRVDILLRQERLCETLGLRARQQDLIDGLIELLEAADDRTPLAEAYLRQGDLFTTLRRFEPASVALDKSLRLWRELGDGPGERDALRSLGLMSWHDGRHEQALRYLDESLELDRRRGDVAGQVGDLVSMGAVYKSLGDLEAARAALEEARDFSQRELAADAELPGGVKLPYIFHTLANVYRALGQSEEALSLLRDALAVADGKHLPIQGAYHGMSIAHILLQRGELAKSLDAYRMAVGASRRARFAPGLSQALAAMGEVLLGMGRPSEALPHLEEAQGLFGQLRDRSGELRVTEAIARGRAAIGEDATEAQRVALELATSIPDRAAEARIRNSIGILAWNRGDYEHALEEYEEAASILRDVGDDADLGLVLNSMGVTLVRLRRIGEAEGVLLEALEVHDRGGSELLEAHAETALGEIDEMRGEPSSARARYERSLDLRRRAGDISGSGWTVHRLARLAARSGRAQDAAELMERARTIAAECGDGELLAACRDAMVHD